MRTTLDVYEVYIRLSRVGASENNRKRLENLSKGDHGIFYISTTQLHKSSKTISEFRSPFIINGTAETVPIRVPTLPPEKFLTCSIIIRLLPYEGICRIASLIEHLGFIKKKEHWGSYLMQPFIELAEADYQKIIDSIGV